MLVARADENGIDPVSPLLNPLKIQSRSMCLSIQVTERMADGFMDDSTAATNILIEPASERSYLNKLDDKGSS